MRALAPRLVFGLLVAAFAASLSLTEIRSLDYWWQLRTGALIAETGEVPRVDPYSYTVPGAPYLDVHWLHQLGLHAVHRLGGHGGIVLAKYGMVLLLAAVLAPIGFRRARPGLSALALALALALASGRFMPRPELPSFVLLAGVMLLLERDRERGGPWAWGVVPLQLVWANLHGLFALGIVVCGVHVAAELARPLAGQALDRARTRRLLAVTAASLLVTLVNPNGLDTLRYPLLQMGMISESSGFNAPWVVELGRLTGERASPGARLLTFGLAAFALAAMVANRRRLWLGDPLLFGGFLFVTLSAHRNQAVFAIVLAPVLVRNGNAWLDAHPAPPWLARSAAVGVAGLLLAGTALAFEGRLHAWLGDPRHAGLGVTEGLQPEGAVDWIEAARPPGPLFHAMADGGYLIWRLHPDYPVMLDGRLEVYGEANFRRLNVGTPRAFEALDRELEFGTALLNYRNQPYDAIVRSLGDSPEWTLAYVDDVAVVFVRSAAARERGIAPVDVASPELFAPLPELPPARAWPRVLARARLYYALNRYDLGLETLERFARRHPERADHPLVHAGLLLGVGRSAEAEPQLQRAEQLYADDAPRLLDVAQLRGQLGDVAGARRVLARAVALDPTLERRRGRRTPRAAAAIQERARRQRIQATAESALAVLASLGVAALALRAQRAGRESARR